jgi:HK97 family phage prohead protease
MKRETKEISFKATDIGDTGQFKGYASTWDGAPDSYNDVISRGAFTKTLAEHKSFPLLWAHDTASPIGVIYGHEDSTGLAVTGQVSLAVQRGREVHALMKMKAITGLSIGFEVIKSTADRATGARRLTEIKLYEISPVVLPACDTARISEVKNAEDEKARALRLFDSIRL